MQLSLEQVGKTIGPSAHLHPMSLIPAPDAVTVLLGATQTGKTSLMRIMASLDVPTTGRVRVDGRDVTGMPVRERSVAMVYQPFINYPSMTVFDNIASPLKLSGQSKADIHSRVRELAEKLHIDIFLSRQPADLSGGQQQRVTLAFSDPPMNLLVAEVAEGGARRMVTHRHHMPVHLKLAQLWWKNVAQAVTAKNPCKKPWTRWPTKSPRVKLRLPVAAGRLEGRQGALMRLL